MKQPHIILLVVSLSLAQGASIYGMDKIIQKDLDLVRANPDETAKYLLQNFNIHPGLLQSKADNACLITDENEANNALARLQAMISNSQNAKNATKKTLRSKTDTDKDSLFKKAQNEAWWATAKRGSGSLLGLLLGGAAIYYGSQNDDPRLTRSGVVLSGVSLYPAWLAYKKGVGATASGQEVILQTTKTNNRNVLDLLQRAQQAVQVRLDLLKEQRTSRETHVTVNFSELPISISTKNELAPVPVNVTHTPLAIDFNVQGINLDNTPEKRRVATFVAHFDPSKGSTSTPSVTTPTLSHVTPSDDPQESSSGSSDESPTLSATTPVPSQVTPLDDSQESQPDSSEDQEEKARLNELKEQLMGTNLGDGTQRIKLKKR